MKVAAGGAGGGCGDAGVQELARFGVRRVPQGCEHQLAIAESERRQLFDSDVLLVEEVAADDAEVDRAQADVTRDVVVTAVEDRKREVAAVGEEPLPIAL